MPTNGSESGRARMGYWLGALIHELLRTENVDLDFLIRYTNAGWLIIQDEGSPEDGLFARDGDGQPLCFDRRNGRLAGAIDKQVVPALSGEFTLSTGQVAVPAFSTPRQKISCRTGIRPARSRRRQIYRRRQYGGSRPNWPRLHSSRK